MNEWPAALWASVSAMTAALVLVLISVLGSFARQGASIQQMDDNAIAIVKEYRKYDQFNGTKNLYAQDVISVIAESRGKPEIWVDQLGGIAENFKQFTASTAPGNFSTATLTSDTATFSTLARFDAKLVKDLNGAILRIEFRRQ